MCEVSLDNNGSRGTVHIHLLCNRLKLDFFLHFPFSLVLLLAIVMVCVFWWMFRQYLLLLAIVCFSFIAL